MDKNEIAYNRLADELSKYLRAVVVTGNMQLTTEVDKLLEMALDGPPIDSFMASEQTTASYVAELSKDVIRDLTTVYVHVATNSFLGKDEIKAVLTALTNQAYHYYENLPAADRVEVSKQIVHNYTEMPFLIPLRLIEGMGPDDIHALTGEDDGSSTT